MKLKSLRLNETEKALPLFLILRAVRRGSALQSLGLYAIIILN